MYVPKLSLRHILFIAIAIACGSGYYALAQEGPHVVTITDEGFSPKELTIRTGDVVEFRNESAIPSWPASDPHPSHTTYQPFDPDKGLETGETWSIAFSRAGLFRFHDHLNPALQGSIRVGDAWHDSLIASFVPYRQEDCSLLSDEAKDVCIEENLRNTIANEGIEKGFALFLHYYKTEPKFVEKSCHWNAHILGEEGYRLYEAGKPMQLVPETSYCGYGFFHGFMTKLVNENPDFRKAKEFCETATIELEKEAPSARANCFHGIGHGYIEDPLPEEYWGKPRELWSRAFPVCDRISEDSNEREECIEGAFNGVVLFMEQNRFNMTLDRDDLFKWCREEPEAYQKGCYYEFGQKLDRNLNYDLRNLAHVLEEVPRDYHGILSWVAVAGVMQQKISNPSHIDLYEQCLTLPEPFHERCVGGIVGGYRAHGEPGTSHERALAFCAEPNLRDEHRLICYEHMFRQFGTIYNTQKMQDICAQIPDAYREKACDAHTI